jgi:predicted PhzF superfamily epimerase YddE/YHI9
MSGNGQPLGTTTHAAVAALEPPAAPQAWLYSSFAAGLGGGNPAGVVVSPEPLEDDVAQAVAAVLSVPTTGFVASPEPGARSVAVRFSPLTARSTPAAT